MDQFENFMSYSPCQNMYSEDQKNLVLSNLENIGFLSNLVSEENHDETGVGTPAVLCKADFTSNTTVICAGQSVDFSDESFSNVIGRDWTFEGGSPTTSTAENPTITYDEAGYYTVELEVTDGDDFVSTTQEQYILVLPSGGETLPFIEDFETISEVPDNERFLVINEDEDDTWELTDNASLSGEKCIYIKNRGNNNFTRDEIISSTIDLSGLSPEEDLVLSFKYAYHKRFEDNDEWIRVFVSNDCGETWVLRKNVHGDQLSEEVQNGTYTPESDEEWMQVEVTNINFAYYTENFRFKIQFENDNGNNIYLDDINIYTESMLSITEPGPSDLFSIFPNPSESEITLTWNEQTNVGVTIINIVDHLGKIVKVITPSSGTPSERIDISELADGLYYLTVASAEGFTSTQKFIKQ